MSKLTTPQIAKQDDGFRSVVLAGCWLAFHPVLEILASKGPSLHRQWAWSRWSEKVYRTSSAARKSEAEEKAGIYEHLQVARVERISGSKAVFISKTHQGLKAGLR
jgi:hypothetical protein